MNEKVTKKHGSECNSEKSSELNERVIGRDLGGGTRKTILFSKVSRKIVDTMVRN